MRVSEIEQALRSMVLLVDTREQNTKRLQERLKRTGLPWRREKLDFGDYSAECTLPGGGTLSLKDKICVERKMDLDELCTCYGSQRDRFTREFQRAKEAGAKLYLLIENGSWEAAYGGEYRSHMRPASLIASMTAWLARYDCQIIQCAPELSGMLIREVLYREMKERLGAM